MRYEPFYTSASREDLRTLGERIADRIVTKIRWYCNTENPLHFAKPMTGPLAGRYRFRVGRYRVIFIIAPNGDVTVLSILHIDHRKDVYS